MDWSVTLDGIRYQGYPLSGEAVRRFQVAVAEAGDSQERQEAALTSLLRLAFPLTWAVLWKGDPVRKLLKHPQREVLLADFFASLTRTPPRSGSPTSGTGLKQQTVM